MKRAMICLMTVVVLVLTLLPAGTPMVMGQAEDGPAVTEGISEGQTPADEGTGDAIGGSENVDDPTGGAQATGDETAGGGATEDQDVRDQVVDGQTGDDEPTNDETAIDQPAEDEPCGCQDADDDTDGDEITDDESVDDEAGTDGDAEGTGDENPATDETVTDDSALVADFDFEIECSTCRTKSVHFTDRSRGGTGDYTYDWDFGDGSRGSKKQNPRHWYSQDGDYTVTLTVTDTDGNVASTSQTVTIGARSEEGNVEPLASDSSTTAAGSWPRCIDGCTAKEVRIRGMWLDVHGCGDAGGSATADIYLRFDNNAERYCFVLVADLYINGEESARDVYYELGTIPAGSSTVMAGTITWPCGAELEVENILVMWKPNQASCGYTCADYNAPSKCYQPDFELSAMPPVIVSVVQSSNYPCPGESVNVTAHVTDADGTVTSVNLTYGSTTVPMVPTGGTPEDGYWEATIEGQLAGTTLTIVVTARDNDGNTVSTPAHSKTWSGPDCTITTANATCAYSTGNTASTPSAGAGASYNWTITGGTITGGQNTRAVTWTAGAAATATISVTVTSAYGCECSDSVEVTVYQLPACHISADPGTQVCAGTNVTLREDGGDAVSWSWTTGATTQSIVVNASGVYGVTVTDENGCTSYCEIEITVYDEPSCSISANPGTEVCAGNNVTLTEDGGDAVSWSWTTGATTQSIVVNASGVYGVTVTDENGCTSYCEIEITVYDEPSCSISANPGTEVCAGNNVTLTEDGGDAVSWSWTTGATTQSIVVNASGVYGVTVTDENGCTSYCEIEITVYDEPSCSISANPGTEVCTGNNVTLTEDGGDAVSWSWTTGATTQSIVVNASGVYGVTVTDENGCTSYCEIEITVYDEPSCSISANPGTEVCAGNNVTLTEDGGDAVSWSWTTGATTQSIVVNASGVYGVTVTDENGCTSYCEIEITVYDEPSCSISANPGTEVCAGNNVTLTEDGGDAVSWSWTTGATTQSIVANASGVYGVTVTDENGCTSYCEIEITVYDEPSCSISANPGTEVCAGNNVTLTEDGGDAVSWSWTTGATTQSIVVNASGVYGVTVTDENGCTSYCEIEITVHELPEATAWSNSPVNQGGTIQLYGGPAGMTYYWTGPGGWMSEEQNPIRTDATTAMAGTYTLTVTNEYGCSDDATTTVVVTVPEVTPIAVGGGGCPAMKYLTVDWEGCITEKPLYSNDRLIVDLLGPSPDSVHNLLLERGTHAPVVGTRTHYLIVIRELESPPATPENTVAVVAFNVTPSGAVFDRDIFLTLGLNQTQLPENAVNVSIAYYDDVAAAWVPLEYEAGGPSGVAELTLSAPIKHFSIFGVLATVVALPGPEPARFVASGLSIQPGIEKIWEAVTFVTRTGKSVTITANIANDGGQEGTYTAVLKLNGKTVDSKTVTVGAGQSRQVSFTESGLEYGRYEVEVAGLSGEFTVSQTIAWWLIIVLIVALALIIWGVVWGRRRGRKASEASEAE